MSTRWEIRLLAAVLTMLLMTMPLLAGCAGESGPCLRYGQLPYEASVTLSPMGTYGGIHGETPSREQLEPNECSGPRDGAFFHLGPSIYLSKGQTIKVTFKSQATMGYDGVSDVGHGRGSLYVDVMHSRDSGLPGFSWGGVDGTRRGYSHPDMMRHYTGSGDTHIEVVIRCTEEEKRVYKVMVVNLDPSQSHSVQYSISREN